MTGLALGVKGKSKTFARLWISLRYVKVNSISVGDPQL